MGIAPDDLVLIPFPAGFAANADGGTGTVGGVTGWAVTAGASKEAVDFLVYYASIDAQKKFAEAGLGIPSAIGCGFYHHGAEAAMGVEDYRSGLGPPAVC